MVGRKARQPLRWKATLGCQVRPNPSPREGEAVMWLGLARSSTSYIHLESLDRLCRKRSGRSSRHRAALAPTAAPRRVVPAGSASAWCGASSRWLR